MGYLVAGRGTARLSTNIAEYVLPEKGKGPLTRQAFHRVLVDKQRSRAILCTLSKEAVCGREVLWATRVAFEARRKAPCSGHNRNEPLLNRHIAAAHAHCAVQ